MSNDCCGTLRCVSRNKDTLKRVLSILRYEDSEYFISRCKDANANINEIDEKDGRFSLNIAVDGAWNCEQFFAVEENRNELFVVGYEKDDRTRPIHGTAHLTNLVELCKRLGFGCELHATEPGNGFEEHIICNEMGECLVENGVYELRYPTDENGETVYDGWPDEVHGIENFCGVSEDSVILGS